jgi:hypothetical protein
MALSRAFFSRRNRWKPAKPAYLREKSAKKAQNPKKIVEIGLFRLTLKALKPHCYQRRGSPEPA